MRKIIFILALAAVIYGFQKNQFGNLFNNNGAFNEDGTPKIELYIHSTCGEPCKDAKSHLKYKKIEAEIFDVSKDKEALDKLRSYTNNSSLPALVVGNKVFHGFNAKSYNEHMYLAKGESVFGRMGKQVYRKHFNADGSPKVVMYAVSWCGYCKQATKKFKDLGIEHVEWNVEDNDKAKERYQYLEAGGYPLIYVGTIRIGAFNHTKINEALDSFKT